MRNLLIAVAALAATAAPVMAETKPQNAWLTLSRPITRDHVNLRRCGERRLQSDIGRSHKVKSLPPLRSCKRRRANWEP